MDNVAFIDLLKSQANQLSDQELLDTAALINEAYRRNYCQFYTEEDLLEEFIDNLVANLKLLPSELSHALKEKILNL